MNEVEASAKAHEEAFGCRRVSGGVTRHWAAESHWGNRMPVATDTLIRGIARNESLTRGLGDIEARMLVEWVVDWAELLTEAARSDQDADALVQRLCRRGRAIGRFVQMWTDPKERGAASQLAATERFHWPLPDDPSVASADLMEHILNWESQHRGE
jgi:hypothetical protein